MSGPDTLVKPRGSLALSEPRELIARRECRGAYRPDGQLARDTLRLWGKGEGECPDPVPEVLAEKVGDRHDEEVLWGGFLTLHYGHFLAESVARLWPLLPGGPLEGRRAAFVTPIEEPFVSDWIEAFGVETIAPPRDRIVHFTHVRVPEPAWRIGGWISPEMREIHMHARNRLDVPATTREGVVWLSRSELDFERRVRDEALCQWLLREHVQVLHPESMQLASQVAAIEASEGIVGPVGSAFHTLLLAREMPGCLYLSPSSVASSFTAQDWLLKTSGRFVHALVEDHMGIEQGRPYRLLVPETLRALKEMLLPDLFDDPVLHRLAQPERLWSSATLDAPDEADLELSIAKVLLDPLRFENRMGLGDRFEQRGLLACALEQFKVVTDLVDGYAYPMLRVARLLYKLDQRRSAAVFAERVLSLEPGSEEARWYAESGEEKEKGQVSS